MPVSHNRSGYSPSSCISNVVSPLHNFFFLVLHFTELFLPSENTYLSSSFQQNLGSTEVVVGTIPYSHLKKRKNQPQPNQGIGRSHNTHLVELGLQPQPDAFEIKLFLPEKLCHEKRLSPPKEWVEVKRAQHRKIYRRWNNL